MKILVDNDLVNYATPGVFCGFSVSALNPKLMSTYDSFDIANPDIYIGSLSNVNDSIIKNIEERPALKSYFVKTKQSDDLTIEKLTKRIGDIFLFADLVDHGDVLKYYNRSKLDFLNTDIVCIEEDFIDNIEYLYFKPSLRYRIYSDKRIINHSNYCGILSDNLKAFALTSSNYGIVDKKNHSNCYLCDCWPITSLCDASQEVETDYTTNIKEAKERVLEAFTNFHTFASIIYQFGYVRESKFVLDKLKELL